MSVPTSSSRTPSPDDSERGLFGSIAQETNGSTLATPTTDTSTVEVVASGAASTGVVAAPIPGGGAPTASPTLFAGRIRDIWHVITLNRKVTIGMSILAFFILVAIFGPLLFRADPNAFSPDTLSPPATTHWLGTTQTGQDVFTQLVDGTRTSLILGFIIGVVATGISVLIGLTAGYFGGMVDDALSLLINVFLVLPAFPLAIVLGAYFPFKNEYWQADDGRAQGTSSFDGTGFAQTTRPRTPETGGDSS